MTMMTILVNNNLPLISETKNFTNAVFATFAAHYIIIIDIIFTRNVMAFGSFFKSKFQSTSEVK